MEKIGKENIIIEVTSKDGRIFKFSFPNILKRIAEAERLYSAI